MAEGNLSAQDFDKWHDLLEAICIQQGHLDNLNLADKLCGAIGNRSQDAFETMQRNLHNWRNGTHTPQRRNFLLLTRILRVDTDPDLRRKWNDLYRQARNSGDPGSDPTPPSQTLPNVRKLRLMLLGSVTCTAILAVVVIYLLVSPRTEDPGYVNIVYHKNVHMDVGESRIIHGRRSACGSMPPSWEDIQDELPDLKTGTWSDGGIGIRNSRGCGGPTPARVLLFTATTKGRSSFSLYGDPITIEVE